MERIRKGSDLPKKNWGSPSIQQKYSQIKLLQRSSALYFVEFRLGARALETLWRHLKTEKAKLITGLCSGVPERPEKFEPENVDKSVFFLKFFSTA